MVTKSSVLNAGRYRNNQSDPEQFGEELLLQLFLAANESDDLITDRPAFQLAQHQLDRQPYVASLPRRRVLPPRRHLRNK